MPVTARNAFCGKIIRIRKTPILTEVSISVQNNLELLAIITNSSIECLELSEGASVIAMIKAPEVLISKTIQKPQISASNCFLGRVTRIKRNSEAVAEIIGELEGGTPICANITSKSAEVLGIKENDQVWFFFKAFSIIVDAN